MPKKIYRMNLQEFKQLMLMALNEGLEELSSVGREEEKESLDEVVPTLIPPERKRFEELKNKKKTGSLTDQEKREYLALLQKDVKLKSSSAKERSDATFGQLEKLSGSKPSTKTVDENFGEQEQTQPSPQQNNQVHGSAAKKFQSKMEKIPGLEQLVAAIKQKGDASVVLKDLAQQIGGDKLPADQILAKAYSLAKKEK